MVKKIMEHNFSEVENSKMAVVDFSAKWCGPCKMLAPILEEVAEDFSDTADFYNIDIDESPELASKFGIASIPTILIFKDGQKVDHKVGFQSKGDLNNFIRNKM